MLSRFSKLVTRPVIAASASALAAPARHATDSFSSKNDRIQSTRMPLGDAQGQQQGGQQDQFTAFDDDDGFDEFWYLDEMVEGFMDRPDFIPREERAMLEREFVETKDAAKK